jgi:hypothetical protein
VLFRGTTSIFDKREPLPSRRLRSRRGRRLQPGVVALLRRPLSERFGVEGKLGERERLGELPVATLRPEDVRPDRPVVGMTIGSGAVPAAAAASAATSRTRTSSARSSGDSASCGGRSHGMTIAGLGHSVGQPRGRPSSGDAALAVRSRQTIVSPLAVSATRMRPRGG